MTSPLQQGAGAPQAPYASTASGMVVNGLTKLYQRGGNTVQALDPPGQSTGNYGAFGLRENHAFALLGGSAATDDGKYHPGWY